VLFLLVITENAVKQRGQNAQILNDKEGDEYTMELSSVDEPAV
jgi:hypothetical protein